MASLNKGKSFGEHTAKELAKRLKKGEDIKTICLDKHMPSVATAKKWIKENKYNAFKARPGAEKSEATGRPSKWSQEIEEEIMLRIIEGQSLRKIAEDPDMPAKSTMLIWKANNFNGFRDQYEVAFAIKVENMAEEVLEIADDSRNDYIEKERADGSTFMAVDSEHISRSKLRVDTRIKLLSKLIDKYKDKQTIDHNVSGGVPTEIRREMVDVGDIKKV